MAGKHYPGWSETYKLMMGLFPNADITQEIWDIWEEQLAPMNQEDVRNAIKTHFAEKQYKSPKLPAVKAILRQIRENRAASHDVRSDGVDEKEYQDQVVRLSLENQLQRLLDMPADELRDAAAKARTRYSMLLSRHEGSDPKDWSAMFQAAVLYVMDDQSNEANRDFDTSELA